MHAYVYKSLRKADTYVYLAARDALDALPEPVRAQLGGLEFVLEIELTPVVSAIAGSRAAFASCTRLNAAAMRRSAAMTSGRRSSSCDGSPAGIGGG